MTEHQIEQIAKLAWFDYRTTRGDPVKFHEWHRLTDGDQRAWEAVVERVRKEYDLIRRTSIPTLPDRIDKVAKDSWDFCKENNSTPNVRLMDYDDLSPAAAEEWRDVVTQIIKRALECVDHKSWRDSVLSALLLEIRDLRHVVDGLKAEGGKTDVG